MSACWERLRRPALIGAVLLLVFATGVIRPGVFHALGVHPIKPHYADLIAILAAGEMQQAGGDPYQHNPLDPYNRPHVYGPWWLVTGDLGLVRSDAWWLGSLLVLATAAAGSVLLAPRNRSELLAAGVVLVSPPVLLAIERGNNDLVVVLLLIGAAWMVTRRGWGGAVGGGALVITAAALKLYPLAALPALAARATSRVRAFAWVGATAAALTMVTLPSYTTYRMIAAMAPEPLTIFGYGAKLIYYAYLTMPDERPWLALGALPVLTAAIWLVRKYWAGLWHLVPMKGSDAACYVAGSLCWSLCYLSTINFPYRMVLLLLPVRLLLKEKVNIAARIQLFATMALMWSPWLMSRSLMVSADGSHYTGSPMAWIAIGSVQMLALALSITFMLAVLGWTWRFGCDGINQREKRVLTRPS